MKLNKKKLPHLKRLLSFFGRHQVLAWEVQVLRHFRVQTCRRYFHSKLLKIKINKGQDVNRSVKVKKHNKKRWMRREREAKKGGGVEDEEKKKEENYEAKWM